MTANTKSQLRFLATVVAWLMVAGTVVMSLPRPVEWVSAAFIGLCLGWLLVEAMRAGAE